MNRHLRIRTAAAALTALAWPLTACGLSGGPSERCVPAPATSATTADLEGDYEGSLDAKGTRLTLTTRPGEGGGTLAVENWPTGDSFREELGASFSTTGTWELDRPTAGYRHALLRLHFDPPKPDLPAPHTLDLLSIGIDAERTFVYADKDPDTCPDFRLQRRQSPAG
ncbi:hypothetical protein ACFZBM_13945 [Streptomyces lavendulae]|uniref:Uncharacterized protein n=1 Tax=Streptomyces lavendulae subsp. lavendulae TaxID=58340 RepID=A0A2K8PGE4_STRLA|nr:hypothetical protein [Streptomyces lavendulae]ATZ25812.1 hypothetical protein SLAV_19940 [Streptomyces lavendulae subsp. lavendulae]QUQ55641.1 hypothetical protein SLLC_18045 [Streptomyces lavendulae subsp. lavendulae]